MCKFEKIVAETMENFDEPYSTGKECQPSCLDEEMSAGGKYLKNSLSKDAFDRMKKNSKPPKSQKPSIPRLIKCPFCQREFRK